MKLLPHLTMCWFLLLPHQAWGALIISEIAWMGDSDSANNEWIELHNTGTAAVDVTDWQLRDANSLTIDLVGSVPAGAYVVLERNRSSEQYLFDPPFLVYTGALVNSGTTLTLYDATGAIADQVAGGESWENIGGDNGTKDTPQYSSAGWVTATPTPGSATIATQSTESSQSDTTTVHSAATATTNYTASRSNLVLTSAGPPRTASVGAPSKLSLHTQMSDTAYVGQPVIMSTNVGGVPTVIQNSLRYHWNLGDTQTASGAEIKHVYDFPGQYVVSVEATYADHQATSRRTVTVLPITLSLAYSLEGDIHIHNDAPYEIDVSGYRIVGDERVVFPDRSQILPNSTITIARSRVMTRVDTPVALYDRAGNIVTYIHKSPQARVTNQSTAARTSTSPPAVVQSVPIATPPVAMNVSATKSTDRNFTFAATAADGSATVTTTSASISRSSTTEVLSDVSNPTAIATVTSQTDAVTARGWWTTGGLILLLSGTILGLWWQRRLVSNTG